MQQARLFVFLRVDLFLADQDLSYVIRLLVLCVSSVPARLPAKASAERSVDSYQQATTVVQATPFAPRRALEQPIRPGAVITLGQATASVGDHDRQTVGTPPDFAQPTSLAGRVKQTRQRTLTNPLTISPDSIPQV